MTKQRKIKNYPMRRLEIDYEKLAEAIVNAEKKSGEIKKRPKKRNRFRLFVMENFNQILYLLISMNCFWYCWRLWRDSRYDIVTRILFSGFLIFVSALFFLSQQEAFYDADKEIQDFFNINISLVALIISFIALFQTA